MRHDVCIVSAQLPGVAMIYYGDRCYSWAHSLKRRRVSRTGAGRTPSSFLRSEARHALDSHGWTSVSTLPVASRVVSTAIVEARTVSRFSVGTSTNSRRCSGDRSEMPAAECLGKELVPCCTSSSANRWNFSRGRSLTGTARGESVSVTAGGWLRSKTYWMATIGSCAAFNERTWDDLPKAPPFAECMDRAA